MSASAVYRMFKRDDSAAPVRSIVVALVLAACVLTGVGIVRVQRQHDVLRLGYELDRATEHVRQQREMKRRLDVELATVTAPERIRKLAMQLGMTTVAPDKIRIVDVPHRKKV